LRHTALARQSSYAQDGPAFAALFTRPQQVGLLGDVEISPLILIAAHLCLLAAEKDKQHWYGRGEQAGQLEVKE
jgi:hypothetical protein